jgi:dimethylaniline monooxygenase (N-oxide forming)
MKDGKGGVPQCLEFDRVIVANGQLNIPKMPKYKGAEKFTGDIMHSRQFKNATKYKGKRVLMVGMGASGADVQSFLVKAGAKKVYISHRGQFLVVRINHSTLSGVLFLFFIFKLVLMNIARSAAGKTA